jgi:hypothetical protein
LRQDNPRARVAGMAWVIHMIHHRVLFFTITCQDI